MPVGVGAIRLGVLSIYSRLPGPALPGQLPAALLAADTAALALLDSDVDTPDALSLSELGPGLDPGPRCFRLPVGSKPAATVPFLRRSR